MPRGSRRSSPFLYCSPLKMIIRKTAWKSSLTLFISISSADAVCSLMRNTHGETLVVFKDTERKTSAEVLTDSAFNSKISSHFSWRVITSSSSLLGRWENRSLCSDPLHLPTVSTCKSAFLLLWRNPLKIPFSRLQGEWLSLFQLREINQTQQSTETFLISL